MYYSESQDVYLLQLRSSLSKGRSKEFVSSLLSWAKTAGVKDVLVLSSSSAEERIDSQLEGTQLRFISSTEEKALRYSIFLF